MAKRQAKKYVGFSRRDRVSEAVMRAVSETIRMELSDPRLTSVSITQVEMSPDNRVAKVFFSMIDPEAHYREAMAGLNAAMGRMRRAVAESVRLQFTPELRFVFDTSMEHAFHMNKLFQEIERERREHPPHLDEGDSGESAGENDSDESGEDDGENE